MNIYIIINIYIYFLYIYILYIIIGNKIIIISWSIISCR